MEGGLLLKGDKVNVLIMDNGDGYLKKLSKRLCRYGVMVLKTAWMERVKKKLWRYTEQQTLPIRGIHSLMINLLKVSLAEIVYYEMNLYNEAEILAIFSSIAK